jgi:hypothetical protein
MTTPENANQCVARADIRAFVWRRAGAHLNKLWTFRQASLAATQPSFIVVSGGSNPSTVRAFRMKALDRQQRAAITLQGNRGSQGKGSLRSGEHGNPSPRGGFP